MVLGPNDEKPGSSWTRGIAGADAGARTTTTDDAGAWTDGVPGYGISRSNGIPRTGTDGISGPRIDTAGTECTDGTRME